MTETGITGTRQRWVIKIGSSLLTADGRGLDDESIGQWVEQIVAIGEQGIEVVLVSSGAVVEGMNRLKMTQRPYALHELQAAAAVGQMGLIQVYESKFQRHGLHTAQILLTHDDLTDRERYINARGTLGSLIKLKVIPVVNENDTVVTDEIRFGDNDTLAALVANLIEADLLLILTDQDGLFDRDPRVHKDARLIEEASASDRTLDAMAGEGSALGRGGMLTKLKAARIASRSGAHTLITHGRHADCIKLVASGDYTGTLLRADAGKLVSRKQWLAGLRPKGQLVLDDGAVQVLRHSGRSLLAVGVRGASGMFSRGDMVACADTQGRVIAHGLINYNLADTLQIMGHPSASIESLLGYLSDAELIHRDNLVLV